MAAFKAHAAARDLETQLQLTIAGITFQELSDASFFPNILFNAGSGAANESMFVKIQMLPDLAGHVNVLDMPQPLYSPHQVIILREAAATAKNPSLREQVVARCAELGSEVQIWEATGVYNQVGFTNYSTLLAAATEITAIEPDTQKSNPLVNAQ